MEVIITYTAVNFTKKLLRKLSQIHNKFGLFIKKVRAKYFLCSSAAFYKTGRFCTAATRNILCFLQTTAKIMCCADFYTLRQKIAAL